MSAAIQQNQIWLNKQKRKAFYTPVASENLRDGAEALLQVSLTTNTEMPEDGWMDETNVCVFVCIGIRTWQNEAEHSDAGIQA